MGYAFGGFLLSIGGVIGVNRCYYEQVTENINGTHVFKTMNSIPRLVSYSAVVAGIKIIFSGIGLSLAPMIGASLIFNPGMLTKALVATGAIFGGSAAFAFMRPRSSLLYLQGFILLNRTPDGKCFSTRRTIVNGIRRSCVRTPLFRRIGFWC
jgi:hypothetical protein